MLTNKSTHIFRDSSGKSYINEYTYWYFERCEGCELALVSNNGILGGYAEGCINCIRNPDIKDNYKKR